MVAVLIVFASRSALACPFCTALGPTLSTLRERAAAVALVEVRSQTAERQTQVHVHRIVKGAELLTTSDIQSIALDLAAKPGALVLVFGTRTSTESAELAWHAVAVDETSYAYFSRLPAATLSAAERLSYFAARLEHASPLIAQDVYLEFGHASMEDVATAITQVPMADVRRWMLDPKVPPERKGFYGLALGLATDPADRRANAELLERLIVTPEDDFRAGFDGALGGYLMLQGESALGQIESRFLANPRAADGDVRHAQTALRFYREYGRAIPPVRLAEVTRHLLARPEFAASAVIDLARWQDWASLDQVLALYARWGYPQPATRRAVVGYLLSCPERPAALALARLRQDDPRGVAEAEAALARTSDLTRPLQSADELAAQFPLVTCLPDL